MNKETKCNCENPIIESNMCEAFCTKCNLLIQMEIPQTTNRIREEWKTKLGQMISLAWKNGIWHSEATLFKDIENFIAELLKSQEESGADEVKDRMGENKIEEWEEPVKKLLGYYNAEILNKYQDKYLMEKGPGCEEVLFPVLEKALTDFLNPPDDGMVRKFNLKSFICQVRQEAIKATEDLVKREIVEVAKGMKKDIVAKQKELCKSGVTRTTRRKHTSLDVCYNEAIDDIIKTLTDK